MAPELWWVRGSSNSAQRERYRHMYEYGSMARSAPQGVLPIYSYGPECDRATVCSSAILVEQFCQGDGLARGTAWQGAWQGDGLVLP
eukprot:scaffold207315_cov22-Prasinocladus_malaysianus.AAC.1